jgi:hypothetical protein
MTILDANLLRSRITRMRNPRQAKDAFAKVGEWLAQPGVVPLHPGQALW